MYEEFDAVLLKDGRFASIVDKDGPGFYTGTVGDSPKDWAVVYLTDADIDRKLTREEREAWGEGSLKKLKEQGYD